MRAHCRWCAQLIRVAASSAIVCVATAASSTTAAAQTLVERLAARDSVAHRAAAPFVQLGITLQANHHAARGMTEAMRDSIAALARAQVGRKYRLGGASPEKGFDCSGLIRYLLAAVNVEVPRTAAQQAAAGRSVEPKADELRVGDLLTFGRGSRVEHIGVYVGNGKFVHASSVAGRVIESDVNRPPARRIRPLRGARRVISTGDNMAIVAERSSAVASK